MNENELHDLIAGGETLTVEFKSDARRLPDHELVDALVAMANAQGGVLLQGVEDKTGEITGLHAAHRDFAGLVPLVENRTTPALSVTVEKVVCANGREVGVIRVPKSRKLTCTNEGKYLRRRIAADGKPEVVGIKPADIQSWQSSLGLFDPSAMVFEGVAMSELDPIQRVRLRQIIEEYSEEKSLSKLSDDELDKALRLVDELDGVAHPTLTGLLFLGTEKLLRQHVPSHEAAFQVLKAGKVKVNEFRHRPLLEVFQEFKMMFGAQYEEEEMEIGLFRKGLPNFDKTAFREAFVNALVHRDYNMLGTVFVQFDDYGLKISNPGGFIDGVTAETLLTAAPKSRNACLADAMKRIGLAERTGRGVDRIFEGLLKYGRPAPDYSESNASCVSVRLSDQAVDKPFVRMLINREDHGIDMPIDSLLALVALRTGELTVEEIARLIGRTEASTHATLGILLREGMIEQKLDGHVHVYFLGKEYHQTVGEQVAYTKIVGLDHERCVNMIEQHIELHGRITYSEVMRLCDLSRGETKRILKEMTENKKIQLGSLGRWAYYVKA